ncbi:superinfection immunity protein [Salmonella enterica]|nr:superinfection immunity protein [Salmonella enterica]
MDNTINAIIFILFAAFIYFMPGIIAKGRQHKNAGGVFILNALTGWTVIGWFASLVLACTSTGNDKA